MAHVLHDDAGVQLALDGYCRAWDEGRSLLVRPRAAYDGLERVRDHMARLAGGPVLVTDLAGQEETVTGAGATTAAAYAFHTSGSTGSPKCVVQDAATSRAHARMVARELKLDPELDHLALPPSHFAYGLSIVNSHQLAGVPVRFVTPSSTPEHLLAALAEVTRPVAVYLLPQQVTLLLAAAESVPDLRTVVVAGGRLSASSAAALAHRFPKLELVNMYGQAELGPRLSLWRGPAAEFVEGRIGAPVEGVVLEVGPPDEAGRTELIARSPYAMSHLLAAPYDAPQPGPAPGEPVRTGDFARRDAEGFVHDGRTQRLANVAGTRIDTADLVAQVERAVPTLAVRVETRRSRVSGDDLLVLQVVPGEPGVTAGDVRRALHPTLGSLVALLEVRLVDHLVLGEAGK